VCERSAPPVLTSLPVRPRAPPHAGVHRTAVDHIVRGSPHSARRERLRGTASPHGPSGAVSGQLQLVRGPMVGACVCLGPSVEPVHPALGCWCGYVRYGPRRSRIDVTRPVRRNAARLGVVVRSRTACAKPNMRRGGMLGRGLIGKFASDAGLGAAQVGNPRRLA
jgi:hypothetical protein